MRDTGTGIDGMIDLSEATAGDELAELRRRMLELEDELELARADVGRLQLQVDLFTSTDPVTGFVNRTGTVDAIQSALDRLDRMGEPVTVLALIVPELTAMRDRLDDVTLVETLRHLGALIAGGLRRVDRVGRLENDTFVSVLSNLGGDDVDIVLRRIEDALTAHPIELDGLPVQVRPRLGALVLGAATDATPDELLDEALVLPIGDAAGPARTVILR